MPEREDKLPESEEIEVVAHSDEEEEVPEWCIVNNSSVL